MTFALVVLVASLLGSVHCAAMCGAFTCLYANPVSRGAPVSHDLPAHLSYNLGRLLAYVAWGAVAGALGAGLDLAGDRAGVARLAPVVAASLMIIWGGYAVLLAQGVRLPAIHPPEAWQSFLQRGVARVQQRPPVTRAAMIGLASGLLPCGWLHAFVLTAAGSGAPIRGAVLMAVFWLGTLPMMLAVGLGMQRLLGPFRARLPALAASVVLLLGVLSLAGHFKILPGATWLHRLTPAVPVADGAPAIGHGS